MAILLALVPVLLFLGLLWTLDSFKLVAPKAILRAIAAGALAALASLIVHAWLLESSLVSSLVLKRYAGPVIEEAVKLAYVLYLIRRARVGFLVDAAVLGFAVGCGFALVENAAYLRALPNATNVLWLVRGLGTAVMHGGATACAAIIVKTLADRGASRSWMPLLPGLALAAFIHSAYNHLLLPPVAAMLVVLIALPLLMFVVFERSERATRDWVGAGLDLDLELLQLLLSDVFPVTRIGRYLADLRARFSGPVAADMFCLLRLELELSVQTKAFLIAREAGLHVPPDDDLRCALEEMEALRTSIGPTGLLVLEPLRVTSDRDRWHRQVLGAGSRK